MTNLSNFSAWVSTVVILLFSFFCSVMTPLGEICFSSMYLTNFLVMKISFLISFMSLIFVMFVSIISLMVFSWGRYYMSSSYKLLFFYILLLGFVSSMFLLVLSNSMISLFLGWEGLGVTSFILIVFYQNWGSTSGGLLTLLTNRLGDAVLMVSMGYWLCLGSFSFFLSASTILGLLISFISFTKSAQWPFISWLPAAMAAPTPVSALVHSSTLVTAGTWLTLRMGQLTQLNFSTWFCLGLVTLLVASTAALLETDAKKIVALSTLSQLGLMFISLALGNISLCLCHILTHALAKSNLFLVVGTILHSRFAEQDSRSLGSVSVNFLLVSAFVSVLSLAGVLFMSGFFTKEQILLGHYKVLSSVLSLIVLIGLSSLTLAYCLKLILVSSNSSFLSPLSGSSLSTMMVLPLFILSGSTIMVGYFLIVNFGKSFNSLVSSMTGSYWTFLLLSFILFSLSTLYKNTSLMLFMGFSVQSFMVNFFKKFFFKMKDLSSNLESSMLESLMLISSQVFSYFFTFLIKSVLPLSIVFSLLLML